VCVWGEGVDFVFFFSDIKNQVKINLLKYHNKVHIQSQYKVYARDDNWVSLFLHTSWILGLSAYTSEPADDQQHEGKNNTTHNFN